ncbi:unnamed protein product, partial [Oppiella nova]
QVMSEYRFCRVCGGNNRDNPALRLGENYVSKGSGVYTCEKDRQWFYKNAKLTKVCPKGEMDANAPENCDISVCPACKLHKCYRIGLKLKPQNSANCTTNGDPAHAYLQPNTPIANNGHNFVVNSNLTPTVGPNNQILQPVAGPSTTVPSNTNIMGSYPESVNTENDLLAQLLDMTDIEMMLTDEMGDTGIENLNPNQDFTQQSPQTSVHNTMAVESYQGAPVAQAATSGSTQTIAHNNTIARQTDTSDDHTIDDMIFTFINKINLGLVPTSGDPLLGKMKHIQVNENHNKIMVEQIRCELKQPGRLTQFLDATGLHREAIGMAEMFRTEEPWPYTNGWDLKVINASILRSGSSKYFSMDSSPRGRAIVFVTVDGLDVEIMRWKSIFGQLGFQYDVYREATCSQILDVLLGVSCQRFDADALLVMFIGGGYDEKIRGYSDRPDMSFTDIADIFSDSSATQQMETNEQIKNANMNFTPMDLWRNPMEDITQFGQAFSYTIAQYACKKHLTDLVEMTNKRLVSEQRDNENQKIMVAALDMTRDIYFNPGENYVLPGSGIYTCEADRQWFYRNAKFATVCQRTENGAPDMAICTCSSDKLHKCFSIGMRYEYNTQDMPQNSARRTKRHRSNTTQGTGFVPNQGYNYNLGTDHYSGHPPTNTSAIQQINGGNTYPAQVHSQQFNVYNQGINASEMHTSTSTQVLANTSMTVAANNGNLGLNRLQTNNTITTPTNSSLDNRIDDMKIQQNEHENKCRIQHIRNVLKDPVRMKQFLDNTGTHQLANELVEMFKMDYPWPYRTDLPELPVVRASELRSGNTRYFFMDSNPRGRAIVFISTDGLDGEADRWESILGQLGFEKDVYRKAKCSQIRDVLLGVSGQPFDADALFVMFIGGGYDEKICGYGGNEMSFKEIVDIFSDTNCVSLRNKPKIFVFNTFSI